MHTHGNKIKKKKESRSKSSNGHLHPISAASETKVSPCSHILKKQGC